MRRIVLATAALALAACNPSAQDGSGSQSGGDGGFPNLFQTAYRAEFTMTNPETGESMPGVMIRDGQKMRMEMTSARGGMIMISNPEAGETYTIMSGGGQQIATRTDASAISDPWTDWTSETSTATPTGPCSGAGETGAGWTSGSEGDVSTTCVTSDGIILNSTHNGVTTWETTSVQRGPQNASLFQLPPGIQVMEFNNMPNTADLMEKMKGASGN
jgi:hypothetical protein